MTCTAWLVRRDACDVDNCVNTASTVQKRHLLGVVLAADVTSLTANVRRATTMTLPSTNDSCDG